MYKAFLPILRAVVGDYSNVGTARKHYDEDCKKVIITKLPNRKPDNAKSMLFHISPAENHASIEKMGIEPYYSKGARKVSWYVDVDRLLWAMAHCSARHGVSVDKLNVYAIPSASVRKLSRSRWQGVFMSSCRNEPTAYFSAAQEVQEND